MEYLTICHIRERVIADAKEHAKTLPEEQRNAYIHACTTAAIEFYFHTLNAIADEDFEKKKSA